jgi:hypothetical protein
MGSGIENVVSTHVGRNPEGVDYAFRVNADKPGARPTLAAVTSTSTSPDTGTSTETTGRPDIRPEHGDHERFAHYAERDKITEAMVTGTPVVALCGKVWVPSRDPQRFPVCPMCQELYDMGPEGRMRFWQERASQE